MMAAPIKKCEICQKIISDRSYRSLTSKTSQEYYKDVFELMCVDSTCIKGFACNPCANKLNRVQKLNNDMKTKQVIIKEERDKLLCTLKELIGIKSKKPSTPKGTKRLISSLKLTPTPKSKVKKGLFVNKTPTSTQPAPVTHLSFTCSTQPADAIGSSVQPVFDKSTQTKDQSGEFDVKIVVKYNGIERVKIVKDEVEQAALKSILNHASPRAVLENLSRNKCYRKEMLEIMIKVVQSEIKQISKKNSDIFKGHASNNEKLVKFDWKCTSQKLQVQAPFLYSTFSSIVGLQKKKKLPMMLTSISLILYGRSQTMNQLQYILGLILQKCGLNREGLNILHDLGIAISPTSLHKKTKELVKQQENQLHSLMTSYVHETESKHKMENAAEEQMNADVVNNKKLRPIEMLGDNLDITITPSKMSVQNQNKSLHWFLILVKQKQITFDESKVPLDPPVDFPALSTVNWIPLSEQLNSLMSNFKFHVANVILHYVPFLQLHITRFPKYIEHMYLDQMRKKSAFLNCDLVEASENTSDGMIEILQRVHQLAVPHVRNIPGKNVLEKVVFGGDVLTNERAFSAQEAMQNTPSEYESLLGIIHRPEGLHREMNFLLGIYQLFYKEKSSADTGSLYQLRNLLNRRNVSGPEEVNSSYRAHHDFIMDVTDSYIIATFLDVMQMEDLSCTPKPIPLLSLMSDDQKNEWLLNAAEKVLNELKINEVSFQAIADDMGALDGDTSNLDAMKSEDFYLCAVCGKQYSKRGWLKKHLQKKHHWKFHIPEGHSKDNNPIQTFLFMSLLHRDTCDSYRMGDGERIIRNVYFEWLFAAGLKHSKYKLWLFRTLCYIYLLSPEQSFEYKWNTTINLKGGTGQCIPNDNCVELQVHTIKSQLNTQGSNKSYKSAKQICMTTQVIDAVRDNLMSSTKTAKSKSSRPTVDKTKDIVTVINCLRSKGFIKDLIWSRFHSFKDPISHIDKIDLHDWILHQKEIANLYLK